MNVDGGARGNPGPAAVAAVATSPDGQPLGERNAYIGEATKHAGLKPLFIEAMRTLREFDGWSVRAVRREHNERADELVNAALDEALSA